MIKALIFDWGDTIMRDFKLGGTMSSWEKVAWIEGAQEVLSCFNKKYSCIIATSADHSDTRDMIAALQRVGADVCFHHFFSQKELGFKKPDIRFFEEVTRQSQFAANECVMIGNSYEMDIVGAKKAGITTVFFNENNLQGNFQDADFVINKMIDLLRIF
ncbi:MAG: HAD family hydrolase [Bacteroidales bacterium]|nr:HAD family hydrolase [Bacteroidales bacterium]